MRTALVILFVLAPATASALPMYAMRSGRTCGNCHVSPTYQDPNGWENPELPKRKCSMSCIACHVNPTGGGLRNTSGRYYGQSTLSMIALQERSYSDYGRELLGRQRSPRQPKIPSNFSQVEGGETAGWAQFGRPYGEVSEYAFWNGRYGDLNPDPMLSFGADARVAHWTGNNAFFPMQLDLNAAVHPIEHVTAMGTLAAKGRASGFEGTAGQDDVPVFMRNAFLMVHELPYIAYAKAGLFMPNFGTNIDDHTSFTREYFEMDVSNPDDTVLGLSLGAAPNYPFANASAFVDLNGGWGGAVDLGWRDLGWSLTAHAMIKRRLLEDRGDLDGAGIGFGFNPFYYSNEIPLTYMAELSVGRGQRPGTGTTRGFVAFYQELWWTVFNGVSVRFKHDLGDRDLQKDSELEQRFSVALDVSPIPGVTLISQGRLLKSADTDWDVFTHIHLWF